MPTDLKGWHPGEVALQRKLGFSEAVPTAWQYNENFMREQHRIFHTSNLPFVPATTVDDHGRPWASILASFDGRIGFITSPDSHTLTIKSHLWAGEPLCQTLCSWFAQGPQRKAGARFLTAGLGIEFSTRRRNKFAGWISDVRRIGDLDYELTVSVNQALGNCPKYVNVRSLVPHPATEPRVDYNAWQMEPGTRLPEKVIKFITEADTVFIGSLYKPSPEDETCYPSHAGMNARGGLPGFVRVCPSDGRTIVLPDYSGNRFLSSLGNISYSGVAALTIVSFTTGDILYLTGQAQVLIGPPAFDLMPRQGSVTTLVPSGCIFVRDALPLRQAPGSCVKPSPYSPPIKYLAEEPQGLPASTNNTIVHLSRVTLLTDDIAVIHFDVTYRTTHQLRIRPGQAIALDFLEWMGQPHYQHMAADAPGSLNDDRIRTWTVSSNHECSKISGFDITMREKKGGAVTTALFDIIREQVARQKRQVDLDLLPLKIDTPVVGVTGDFDLPQGNLNLLWVAGGIGITPFLAMFAALYARGSQAHGEIVLALSAREPLVFLELVQAAFPNALSDLRVRIDVFFTEEYLLSSSLFQKQKIEITAHKGRIQSSYWKSVAHAHKVLICGPSGFSDAAVENLRAVGIANDDILREGFF